MRVLVCGSRTWRDATLVFTVLNGLYWKGDRNGPYWMTIIEGGADGADASASDWAEAQTCVEHLEFPADWDRHGKAAGPIRNQQMLDEGKPELVVAFTEQPAAGRGTADMIRRAKAAGVPVWVVGHG